ncbi:MAG: hypothetical protein PVI40_00740 [Chlamydiota bacterium]
MRILFLLLFLFISTPETKETLNRPTLAYKARLPQLPPQSKDYINIANYNARTSFLDKGTPNSWENRKEYYLKTLKIHDESYMLLEHMQTKLRNSLNKYLTASSTSLQTKKNCITCEYENKEAFPVFETEFFRIALKTVSSDEKGFIYGNFPYPYRLIIALKRHASQPSEQEWLELRIILQTLERHVKKDLGADYTSYASLQDNFYKNKKDAKPIPKTPHYFIHFIFRFTKTIEINGIPFKDPNPFDQFNLHFSNLISEEKIKSYSNFIYKRQPDIINIQELTIDQTNFLKNKLKKHKFISYAAADGKLFDQITSDDYYHEILSISYRSDRFECLDHGVRWISATPDKPSIGYGASRQRIIIWGKFKDKRSGKFFYIFNAHYDHLGGNTKYVDSEILTIKKIAKDCLWFSAGERFYKSQNGENLYRHYLTSIECNDVRDISLLGHFGESGSWGGFPKDQFACSVKGGNFECDTLDVCFTNAKKNQILLTYSFSGAYNPKQKELYSFHSFINDPYQLASDHFMIGFYLILNEND